MLDPSKCDFKASSVLGKTIKCTDLPSGMTTISQAAVKAAEAIWAGYHTADDLWRFYGMSRTANLSMGSSTLLTTTCDKTGNCTQEPFGVAPNWVKNFLMKDPKADPMKLTHAQFDRFCKRSVQEWSSLISTDDPDLGAFKEAGGKFIAWHGLDDTLIMPGGTEEYYNRVLDMDPKAADYYRFFEAPGVGHCQGGFGAFPGTSLQSLMDWVEKGVAPETLYGRTIRGAERPICAYPKKVIYNGDGQKNDASQFSCV